MRNSLTGLWSNCIQEGEGQEEEEEEEEEEEFLQFPETNN